MTPDVPVIAALPTEDPEVVELEDDAREWQEKFHQLKDAIEARGFTVAYGDNGEPVVSVPAVA